VTDTPPLQYWKSLPDRDQVLDRMYNFLKTLAAGNIAKANSMVLVKDINQFMDALHDSLRKYLNLVIEDEQWEQYADSDLIKIIDNPYDLDEDLTQPEFSGKDYVVGVNEDVSVLLSMKGYVTSIRLHFLMVERDELFFLKLHKISSK